MDFIHIARDSIFHVHTELVHIDTLYLATLHVYSLFRADGSNNCIRITTRELSTLWLAADKGI